MSEKVTFLEAPGLRVIDEVLDLMDPNNPVTACGDLPETITRLADRMAATLKTKPWRPVKAESGAVYPAYIAGTDPYVVYAIGRRAGRPHMYVMHVGLSNGLIPGIFFPVLEAEIDRRLAVKGWFADA
jgi:hypothetical protein